MGDIATAKRTRSAAAGWLTRAAKACEELHSQDLKSVSGVDYESTLDNFNRRLDKWDEAEFQVEELLAETDLEGAISSAADYRETMEKARNSLITAWVAAYPPLEEGRAPSEPGSAGVNVKLPKLDLPKFSGDVLKWVAFWQQFCACVDNQDIPGSRSYQVQLPRKSSQG